jgi:cytochrome b561
LFTGTVLFNTFCFEYGSLIGKCLPRDAPAGLARTRHEQEGLMTTETTSAYDPLLRRIHWLTAALFIAAMLIGFFCGLQQPGTSPRRELLEVHKSLGATLFFLAILRLMVRAATTAPGEVSSFGPWVRLAARLNHWALYFILFAMPITGYVFSSAGGYSLKYFWTFSWPRLVVKNNEVARIGETSHELIAWLVYAAVALHIAATFWHVVVKRDETLSRMWQPRN